MKIFVDEMPEHEYGCLFYNSCTDLCELSRLVYYQGEHECLGVENCPYLMQLENKIC